MSAKILPLPGIQAPSQPIAHYLRIGHTAHRQWGTLYAGGRLPAERAVVDAAKLKFQKDLVGALKNSGVEIVLDTNAAELSALARFDGVVKTAPWAPLGNGGPLKPEDFVGHSAKAIRQIARFAVEHGVDAVLAPGHFLRSGCQDKWFDVDRDACVSLRDALDLEGGQRIAIDYLLMPTYTHLHDEAMRGGFMARLEGLPFDNLWIRASGFGADGSPLGARRYITALLGLNNLGKPVVADHVGGLIGLAAVAFGAASGIAHGVGEHERFDAGGWDKARKVREPDDEEPSGGRQIRVAVSGLDKSLTVSELDMLQKARGGHRLVVCGDRNCCPHGFVDMTKNWRAHFVCQRLGRTQALQQVPDHNRVRHFLEADMAHADRVARQVKELKISDGRLTQRLVQHSRRMEGMRTMLENLAEVRGRTAARSLAAIRRGKSVDDRRGEM